MKNDPIQYFFTLPCPDSLLWWLLIVCLFGCLITGGAIIQISTFVTDKNGKRLSLLKLQGLTSAPKLQHHLSPLPQKALHMIRKSLVIDYAFMPFLYLLMAGISCLLLRHAEHFDAGWKQVLYILCWLPFVTWLLDILENAFALSIISNCRNEFSNMNKSQVVLLSLSSVLKWLISLGWLLLMTVLLILYLVRM